MCKSMNIDFLYMITISMHETSLGTCLSPATWKGKGTDASENLGTGYMACNVWAQRNVARSIFDSDTIIKSWSDLAIRLDNDSEYTYYNSKITGEYYAVCCSRDSHFGNLVCGVVTLKENLAAASNVSDRSEQLYKALLYYGNNYDDVPGLYKKHLNGEKTMSDQFIYCYTVASEFFKNYFNE